MLTTRRRLQYSHLPSYFESKKLQYEFFIHEMPLIQQKKKSEKKFEKKNIFPKDFAIKISASSFIGKLFSPHFDSLAQLIDFFLLS